MPSPSAPAAGQCSVSCLGRLPVWPMGLRMWRSSSQQVKKSGHSVSPVCPVLPAPTHFSVPSQGRNCPHVSLVLGGWGSTAMRGWDRHLSAHGDASREALQSAGRWPHCKGCWSQPAPGASRAAALFLERPCRLHFAAEQVPQAGHAAGDVERQLCPRAAPEETPLPCGHKEALSHRAPTGAGAVFPRMMLHLPFGSRSSRKFLLRPSTLCAAPVSPAELLGLPAYR